jgi:hypothetical protein
MDIRRCFRKAPWSVTLPLLAGSLLLKRNAGRHLQLALVPVKVDEVTILGDDQMS